MSKEESKPDNEYVTIVTPDLMYWKSVAEELKKELYELRKENEELKELLDLKKIYLEKAMKSHHHEQDKNADLESQLSKAKELLRTATTWMIYRRDGKVICDEIESFLKS